jgi:hypothetical protein
VQKTKNLLINVKSFPVHTGLRRLRSPDREPRRRPHGARGAAQLSQPPRLRGDRRREGRRGAQLPAHCFLRRHPRVRGPRQRQPHRQHLLPGPGGPPRRARVQRVGRHPVPPGAEQHGAEPHRRLRPQGPQHRGYGGAVRLPHHRPLPLRLLPVPEQGAAGERDHQPGVPGAAGGAVPAQHKPSHAHHDGDRPEHADGARQQLLQAAAAQPGPALLRRPAHPQRHARALRQRLRRQRDALEGEVRRRHDQDGQHRGQHRHAGGDPPQLQRRQPGVVGRRDRDAVPGRRCYSRRGSHQLIDRLRCYIHVRACISVV